MNKNGIQDVRLKRANDANYFVRNYKTGRLIGRVWRESNGEWWATFYLAEGNVSGAKFGTRSEAVAAVRAGEKES